MKKYILPSLIGILLFTGCRNPAGYHPDGHSGDQTAYSVSVAARVNGVISAKPNSAPPGTEIILQVNPKEGYKLRPGSLKITGPAGDTVLGEGQRSFTLPAHDVTVTGEFEALSEGAYSVSVLSGTGKHGLIIPSPEFGPEGTTVFFSLIPDEGYRYVQGSLKAGNTAVNEVTRTLVLPSRHVSVDADFEPVPPDHYTVRINSPVNGRIIARPECGPRGAEIYLQVIAGSGYALKAGTLKYQGPGGDAFVNESLRTITMPAGHILVSGEFEKLPDKTWSVGIENLSNGHIFTESKYGKVGDKITLQIFPEPGFTLKPGTLKYKTSTGFADISGETLSFTMPEDNVMIQGEFIALSQDVFSVRAGLYNNGKIVPFPEDGKKDTNIYLWVKPDIGYQLKPGSLWYVDSSGHETEIDDNQSFLLPASHVKIKAQFEPLSAHIYTIDSEQTPKGHIIARPGSGKEGDTVALWVLPEPGYYYKKGTLKYKNVPSNVEFLVSDETRTFKLNASSVQVQAEFLKIPGNNFMVRAMPADHGMIYPRQDYGYGGQRIEMLIRPDTGYRLKPGSLYYRDGNNMVVKFTGNDTNFNMPREFVSVYGEFEAITYTVNPDNSIKDGTIKILPQQAVIGTAITVEVSPKNGYRLTPNSLKYRSARGGGETAINEKTNQFPMPPEDIIVMAQFEPYIALGDLKVNGRPVKELTGGKTDYTVWIPNHEATAEITFTAGEDITVDPGSGKTVSLEALEKLPVVFIVNHRDVKTNYTITVIRELIPSKAVPGGSFKRDENANNISIVSPFRMGEREVTQAEWLKVTGFSRGDEGDTMPAHKVSWYEAVVFCNRLSMLEGKTPVYHINNNTDPAKWGAIPDLANRLNWNVSSRWDADGYRLPTEMEWHWAAMGADTTLKDKPNTSGYKVAFAGFGLGGTADEAAWFKTNSGGKIHLVGEKASNELGIRDLNGNVMEWCWDWVNGNYQKNYGLGGVHTNFRGGDNNTGNKMRRGGCFLSEEADLVLNYRGNETGPQTEPIPDGDPRTNDDYVGLRIVYRN